MWGGGSQMPTLHLLTGASPHWPSPRSCQKEPHIPPAGNAVFSFEDDLRGSWRAGTAVACGPRAPRKLASQNRTTLCRTHQPSSLALSFPHNPRGDRWGAESYPHVIGGETSWERWRNLTKSETDEGQGEPTAGHPVLLAQESCHRDPISKT